MTSYNLLDSSTLDKYRSAIYSSHTPLYNKNEHAVNSAFHCQQSIDFPLHGCYTASWHLEKHEYLLYLKDYDMNAHTGHFLWWAGLYRDPSFVLKMSSGYSRIENWMTVQFDTVSEKQATTTQRVCEPPRGWNTAQKTGPGTRLGRTAAWTIIKHYLLFCKRKHVLATLPGSMRLRIWFTIIAFCVGRVSSIAIGSLPPRSRRIRQNRSHHKKL